MKRKVILLIVTVLCLGAVHAHAQMTDEAIVSYIAEGLASGKSQTQLGSELLSKGVSSSQIQRLIKAYKSGEYGSVPVDGPQALGGVDEDRPRRGSKSKSRKSGMMDEIFGTRADSLDYMDGYGDRDGFYPYDPYGTYDRYDRYDRYDKSGRLKKGRFSKDYEYDEYDEIFDKFMEDSDTAAFKKALKKLRKTKIYGQDVFRNPRLSFEPNDNAATPEDYVLGPGDELVIDIWGMNEATIRRTITPEGRIIISQVGAIELSGLTIKDATSKIKSALSRTYSGISGKSSQISVTLGSIRTIQVNILGEVKVPGTYRLSSFSTVFNALYRAGGVTKVGSLRAIKIMRAGEQIATVDLYTFLFEGRQDTNVSLKEGDAIIVPSYETVVEVKGGIKRPMRYEMAKGETLDKLIAYAGGYSGDAHRDDINVTRQDGTTNRIFTVSEAASSSFELKDGDLVNISMNAVETFENMVEIRGAVYRPGKFELGGDIATVKQLVAHAGGLLDDAFTARAQIIREKEDRSLELSSVALGAIVDGNAPDIVLKKNDILVVSNSNDIIEKGDFTITGYVVNPGAYQYADNTTVEDLILLAGGLTEGASTARVDVSRRIDNPGSMEASDTLAQVFTFGIKDGLVEDGTPNFYLQPYDVVAVRRSPTYVEQKIVTVTGEVTFPGQYTLVSNEDRISDLISRAGGPTPKGNVKGGMLKRKINQYERNVRTTMAQIIKQGTDANDSLSIKKIKIPEVYTVGVEMDKAIAHPGSDYDMVLRDGDEIVVPEAATTVRVQGEVLYPNTVHFISGKSVGYYVRQAGGYSIQARRAKVYVVHMNGTVSVGHGSKLEPGCEIIVPRRSDRNKLTTGEWLGIGTSAASITTMIATIISLFK